MVNDNQISQNFDIDLDKINNDMILEIDGIRSITNVISSENIRILNSIKTPADLSTLRNKLEVGTVAQESRCHAFFRLIGFPICSSDSFYNPGFIGANLIKAGYLDLSKKIEIINSLRDGFRKFSTFRESYLSDLLYIFSQKNGSIDASTLCLSSSSIIREIASIYDNVSDTFINSSDFDIQKQSYKVNYDNMGLVGSSLGNISLLSYIDESGNNASGTLNKFKDRYHLIFPFMVDPWISETVCPITNMVSVPFVLSKNDLVIGEEKTIKRPLIEKIIRDRFIPKDLGTFGGYTQSLIQLTRDVPDISKLDLVDLTLRNNNFSNIERLYFNNYYNIMIEIARKLNEAQINIKRVQLKYYWLPIPSQTGPEGGATIRSSLFSEKIANSKFMTQLDKDLFNAILSSSISNEFNSYDNDLISSTLLPDTISAFGNKNEDVLSKLTLMRNEDMDNGNKSLKDIEIIMGEFSGLGLIDIIIILCALYIMPKKDLLGLLDDGAYKRGNKLLSFNETRSNLDDAMKSLTKTVKELYHLMNAIYISNNSFKNG